MKETDKKRNEEIILSNFVWLRKKYGLSRKDMAAILRIGIGSWNKIERGIPPPRMSVDVLDRMEETFGIPIAIFLSRHLQ
ncbi:MAG: helix-turn-helix transcriptional regulator [Oscillospiraceae bacterium]|nr:helix-turn-helix transcriptional regulator [Oscillospiraceae bacterium]